jgi:hypothetical protein
MHTKRLKAQLETLKAVVASNSVKTFYVGVTSRDPYKYWAWYWKNGYKHAVILADWLTEKDAKYLEEFLQRRVYEADKRTPLWRKAHGNHKNGRYYLGAKSSKPSEKVHAVYVAWW